MSGDLYAFFQRWRLLSFVACNILILLVGACALMPFYSLIADRDSQIVDKQDALAHLQLIAARESEVQALARQPDKLLEQGEFLAGSNEGVIGADLQTRLKSISERSGTRIRTIQNQPAKLDEPLKYIGVRLTIYGSIQRIHKTIYEIEASKPYLFITSAAIKSAASTARGETSEEPVIEARLDVFGVIPTVRPGP